MRPRWLLLIIISVFAGLGIFYSVTTPILETPDEVWHYANVRELAIRHRLPVVDAEGKQPYRHEGLQPPLYYVIGSVLIGWMNAQDLATMPAPNPYARIGDPQFANNDNRNAFLHTPDESFPYRGTSLAVHLLRWYSILLGATTIVLTFLLAREIFPDQLPIAFGAAAFVAFLPQFLFISSAVSNDNLATLLTVATLWQLARMMRRGTTNTRVAILGLLIGAALLTKLNTIALAGLAAVVLFYRAGDYSQVSLRAKRSNLPAGRGDCFVAKTAPRNDTIDKREWRIAFGRVVMLGAIVAIVAGWWYVRNWLLYGDPTTFARLAVLVGERASPLSFWRWFSAESEGLRLSFWGVFGWFNILAVPQFYFFFDALALVGLIGIGIALMTRRGLSLRLAILPLWCALIFVALWQYASIIITSQGRLLFPALPAWAILWSWGVLTLIPARFKSWALAAIGGALAIIAALVPVLFIAPAYAPTIVADLPQNAAVLDWHFDNGIEWTGATVNRQTVHPGEQLKVTIYARLPAGNPPRDAIFIHLVNSAEVIVAQRDSFIGSGNLVARQTPMIVADTFDVSVPLGVPAPDEWRVQMGMYDPASGARYNASDAARKSLGDSLTLATLPAQSAGDNWNFDFDGHVTLAGGELSGSAVPRGNRLTLDLHWSNLPNRPEDYHVFAHVLGTDDHIWAAADTPLTAAPATRLELDLDPQTPPGVYQIELGVYPVSDGSRLSIFDQRGQGIGDRLFLGPIRVTDR